MDVLLIKDGRVRSCILAESVERAQQFWPDHLCVQRESGSQVGPGWGYDAGAYTAPAPLPATRSIAPIDLIRRFTFAEECAIRQAAKNDVEIEVFLVRLLAVNEVSLDHPETIAGVQMMAAKTLIAAGRVAQILE